MASPFGFLENLGSLFEFTNPLNPAILAKKFLDFLHKIKIFAIFFVYKKGFVSQSWFSNRRNHDLIRNVNCCITKFCRSPLATTRWQPMTAKEDSHVIRVSVVFVWWHWLKVVAIIFDRFLAFRFDQRQYLISLLSITLLNFWLRDLRHCNCRLLFVRAWLVISLSTVSVISSRSVHSPIPKLWRLKEVGLIKRTKCKIT